MLFLTFLFYYFLLNKKKRTYIQIVTIIKTKHISIKLYQKLTTLYKEELYDNRNYRSAI